MKPLSFVTIAVCLLLLFIDRVCPAQNTPTDIILAIKGERGDPDIEIQGLKPSYRVTRKIVFYLVNRSKQKLTAACNGDIWMKNGWYPISDDIESIPYISQDSAVLLKDLPTGKPVKFYWNFRIFPQKYRPRPGRKYRILICLDVNRQGYIYEGSQPVLITK